MKYVVSSNEIQLIRNNSLLVKFNASELSPDSTADLALFTRGTVPFTELPQEVFELHVPTISGVPLSYTRFGTYAKINANILNVNNSNINPLVAFVFGQPTANASMPTSGTGTYSTGIFGAVVVPNGLDTQFYTLGDGYGSASFSANFASGTISTLVSLDTQGGDFGDMTGTGVILSGGPAFNGTLSGSASGGFTGAFFGPNAVEMGYVFEAEGSNFLTYGNVFGTKAPPP